MKALTMSGVAVAVAVVTYFGLGLVFPPQQEVQEGQDHAQALSRVFSDTLQETPIEAVETRTEEGPAPETGDAAAETAPEALPPEADAAPVEADTVEVTEDVVAEEPAPVQAAEPEPAPAETVAAAPAPAPAQKPAAAPKAASKPQSGSTGGANKNQNPAPTWWGRSAPGDLNLVYAGSAAYARALVLMFDGDFKDPSALSRNIKVVDASGKIAGARWEINDKNPRMAVLPLSAAGTYRVSVSADLTDAGGRKLGTAQQGPVRIP